MPTLVLHHVLPSFYSQVARLALAEKGATWTDRWCIAGPPLFDNYKPEYARLNPEMTVPTLVVGDTAVPGSLEIARWADANLDGPPLLPADPEARAEVERWVDAFKGVSIRELTYGTMGGKGPARVNAARLKVLHEQRAKAPALADVYDAKIADIQDFSANAADPAMVDAHRARVNALLDELDQAVAAHPFVVGDVYTLADVAWTVTVARLMWLKLDPLAERPMLAAWYQRCRSRPSFERADVWEAVKPLAFPYMLSMRLPALPLGLLAVTGLVIWLLLR